jgi:hypothetical protein
MYKKYDLIIGIDPGVNTGIAIWDNRNKKLLSVQTVMAVQAEEIVKKMAVEGRNVLVRYEEARLRVWFGKEKGTAQLQGAGSIKRDCSRWEEFLTHNQIEFEEVAPKNNRTKMPSLAFKILTGWKDRTSEHSRDAAALIFGL